VRVTGNEVTEVSPPGDFGGVSAGIMLRPPYLQFEVSHNQVQRDATPSTQASNSTWHALVAGDVEAPGGVSRVGRFATVTIDDERSLVLGGGRPYLAAAAPMTAVVAAAAPAAAAAAQPSVRGSVIGNVLTARGGAPAVAIVAAGECLFNGNGIESRNANRTVATVALATPVAIVNANRVRGGEVSIQIAGAKSAAVLGNVTSGAIVVPGGLQPPWDALNLRG
jgi:hypothetical protein